MIKTFLNLNKQFFNEYIDWTLYIIIFIDYYLSFNLFFFIIHFDFRRNQEFFRFKYNKFVNLIDFISI